MVRLTDFPPSSLDREQMANAAPPWSLEHGHILYQRVHSSDAGLRAYVAYRRRLVNSYGVFQVSVLITS